MNQDSIDKLSELNKYQIAGLAVLGSTLAALSVVFTLRRFGLVRRRAAPDAVDAPGQTPTGAAMSSEIPQHFSEDLLVPGITYTGAEVQQQDDHDGRSPEGV
ncbi:MAG: hypothetical protein M3Z66_24935 [Chloroflexota bacterium]|nr:hypothetical protein [Chloroflexota bacterium]